MEIYRQQDMFIEELTESPVLLDSTPTESEQKIDPLYRYLCNEDGMWELNMVTLTLKPEYHAKPTAEQYNMFRDVIRGMNNETTSYYASFEFTKKGVLHVHMIVEWAFECNKKVDMKRFLALGFTFCTKIHDINGAIAYINKEKHIMGKFPALYN